MSEKEDLTGQKFGKLIVINSNVIRDARGRRRYLCKCECGNKTEVDAYNMKSGKTNSCGCSSSKLVKGESTEHLGIVEGTNLHRISGKSLLKSNASGTTGVYWDKQQGKWRAQIGFKGKVKYLGLFVNKQNAINARKEAEEKYFKPILEKYETNMTDSPASKNQS